MKKNLRILYVVPVLLGIISAAGCSGEKESKASDSDTVVSAEPEEELEEFSSADLGLWNLTGPVAGAVFYSGEIGKDGKEPSADAVYGLDSITFNRQGLVTSLVSGELHKGTLTLASDLEFRYNESGEFISGDEKMAKAHGNSIHVKLSRSSGGYLQMLQLLGPDRELSNSDTYVRLLEWGNGCLIYDTLEQGGEGTVRVKYTYNSDGYPEKVVSTIADMGGETRIEDRYTYTEYDRYGNWTRRTVERQVKDTETEPDGTNAKTTESTSRHLDRRRIYYYPPKDRPDDPVRELLQK